MDTQERSAEKSMVVETESEVRGGRSAKEIALEGLKGLIYAIAATLLGTCGLPFGAYPLGIAFLCAADRKVIYIFLGVCASALVFSEEAILLVATYGAVLIIRTLTRLALDPPKILRDEPFFSENLLLRMATASVGGFIVGLYALMDGGFLYYDLFGALILIIGAPLAVFVFYGIFNQSGVQGKLYYVASAAIAAGAVYGASGLDIYGVSVSAFLALSATLYVTRRRGIIEGVACGVVCGLAYSPLYAPVFIFAALMYGALRRVSALFAAMAAFTAGIAWGVYVGGVGAISALLSALLASSLTIGVIDKLFFGEKKAQAISEELPEEMVEEAPRTLCALAPEQISELRAEALEGELGKLGEAFSELSALFGEIGDRMKKPLSADIRQICDSAFDSSCASCRNKEHCWDERYTEMLAAVNSMSAAIHREGRLADEEIPETLRERCERIGDITGEIRHNTARHMRELLLFDKSEIFALDYAAIAELIASRVKRERGEYEADAELSEALARELAAFGESVLSACVCGKERKRAIVTLDSREAAEEIAAELQKTVSQALGVDVKADDARESGGAWRCVFSPSARFAAESACASRRSSEEETYCGDTVNIFSRDNGKFYSLISDGMGSGADAALSSRICAVFMEKMLSAGSAPKTAMRMLNGFLRNKGGGSLHECSATLDLLEMDMYRGTARIYKCGAAPSYVFRSGELFKLSSKTLPIGIMEEVDSKKLRFDLKSGDVIIMVSDGVTQGREECPWLYDLLRKTLDAEGIGRCVELILERAARESGEDDVSVVALKVSRNS